MSCITSRRTKRRSYGEATCEEGHRRGGGHGAARADGLWRRGSGDGQPSAWVLNGGVWPVVEQDFEAWNEEHPEQAFTVDSFANDVYKERIRTAVGSGESPTLIVGWTGGTLLEYVEHEYVADITEETSGLSERLIDSVAANGRWTAASTRFP